MSERRDVVVLIEEFVQTVLMEVLDERWRLGCCACCLSKPGKVKIRLALVERRLASSTLRRIAGL